jgi:hypothetical protein
MPRREVVLLTSVLNPEIRGKAGREGRRGREGGRGGKRAWMTSSMMVVPPTTTFTALR